MKFLPFSSSLFGGYTWLHAWTLKSRLQFPNDVRIHPQTAHFQFVSMIAQSSLAFLGGRLDIRLFGVVWFIPLIIWSVLNLKQRFRILVEDT